MATSAKDGQPLIWTNGSIQGTSITTDSKGKGDTNGWLKHSQLGKDLHFDYIGGLDGNQEPTMVLSYHTMVASHQKDILGGYSISRSGIRKYSD